MKKLLITLSMIVGLAGCAHPKPKPIPQPTTCTDPVAVNVWQPLPCEYPKPMPPVPTREQLTNVQADFCNLTDSKGRVMFTPFLFSLMAMGDVDSANDWLAKMKAAGDTHIVISPAYAYANDGGFTYSIPGADFHDGAQGKNNIGGIGVWGNLAQFRNYVEVLIRSGFYPVIMMNADGQTGGSGGIYGYDWFVKGGASNLVSVLKQEPDLTPYVLFVPGWELIGPGGDHTPDQIQKEMVALRKAVGPGRQIGIEFGQGYIHVGGGDRDWYQSGLIEADAFLVEFNQPLDRNIEGLTQIADRVLAGRAGPYYFAKARPRGKMSVVAFEYDAYDAIRGRCNQACQTNHGKLLKSFGFTLFGNGGRQ